MMFIILYIENSSFGVNTSWPDRVSTFCLSSVGRVGSVTEKFSFFVPVDISESAIFRCCRKQHCDTSSSQWYFHPQWASLKLHCAAIYSSPAYDLFRGQSTTVVYMSCQLFISIDSCLSPHALYRIYTAPFCGFYIVLSWLYPAAETCLILSNYRIYKQDCLSVEGGPHHPRTA